MRKEFAMLGVLVVLGGFISAFSDGTFLTQQNLNNVGKHTALLTIFAIGEAFVIITGGIDLSVGAIVGFSSIFTVMASTGQFHESFELPITAAALLAVVLCAGIGLTQGLLITRLRLAPFIVTLAGMMIVAGLSQVITSGTSIGLKGAHRDFAKLADASFLLPVPFWVLIAVSLIAVYLLHFSHIGRYIYGIGGNREAARYSGVKVDLVETGVYVWSASLAGLAGVLYASYLPSLSFSTGQMYELYAIAACVLGGCSLLGGEGTVLGVLIGGGIMQTLRTAITLFVLYPGTGSEFRLSSNWERFIVGAVILAAVLLDYGFRRSRLFHRQRGDKHAAAFPVQTASPEHARRME